MDNQQPAQTQVPSPKKANPLEMLSQTMLKLPSKLKSMFSKKIPASPSAAGQTSSQPETQVVANTPKAKLAIPKIPKKVIIIATAALVLFITLLLVIRIIGNSTGSNVFPLGPPTSSPTPNPEVEVPSQYADDEDVKKIEEDMKNLTRDLNEARFRDDRLRVPALDWDITFD